jgi:alkylation response protein AidB-like acyl-CoA dehydrogenase
VLPPLEDSVVLAAHIELAPDIDVVRRMRSSFAAADAATVKSIVDEAAKFASASLHTLNEIADRTGCVVVDGRVRTPPGYQEAWRAFIQGGWSAVNLPAEFGGHDLPLFLTVAVQELFDRGCMAFGMLPVALRCAAKVLQMHASPELAAEWVPRLARGEWAATICISEPDAGSDVGRIRTTAERQPDGQWRVSGEKIWISFGDHDLTPRIGHCLLARTPGSGPGGAGLSLFLVPNTLLSKDGRHTSNGVFVRRIEEKLGIHGSPTCALGFEAATAHLIGVEGRGLAQLFVMIVNMRLAVGIQGVALANAACDVALGYAHSRRQGGPPNLPPVAISRHPDVQRQLLDMIARAEAIRGLGFAIAAQMDIAHFHEDPVKRSEATSLVAWLLPIFKTLGGEAGFDISSRAIQVLGGAGYTTDWPLAQALRDARIITIYEGTSGMQALDLIQRRLLGRKSRSLESFLTRSRKDVGSDEASRAAAECFASLEKAAVIIRSMAGEMAAVEAVASPFLRIAGIAALAWIAMRFSRLHSTEYETRLAAAGSYFLADAPDFAGLALKEISRGMGRLERFSDIAMN